MKQANLKGITKAEIEEQIAWAENEIWEYKQFIKLLKGELKKRIL